MNMKNFHSKKIKTISVASSTYNKEELTSEIFLEKKWLYFDPILNQKIAQWFHNLVKKLKETENFDIRDYKISHRFIGSTARWLPRDTFDKRVKKELVQLLESNGVYPYTT